MAGALLALGWIVLVLLVPLGAIIWLALAVNIHIILALIPLLLFTRWWWKAVKSFASEPSEYEVVQNGNEIVATLNESVALKDKGSGR